METLGQRIYELDKTILDIYHRLVYYPEDSSIYQEMKQSLQIAVEQEQKLYAQLEPDSLDYQIFIYQLDSFYQSSLMDFKGESEKTTIMRRIEVNLSNRESYLFLPYGEIIDEVGSRDRKVLDKSIGENIFTYIISSDFDFIQFLLTKNVIDKVVPEDILTVKVWCYEQIFSSPVLEYSFLHPEQAKTELLSHRMISQAQSIAQKDQLKSWLVSSIDEGLVPISQDIWRFLCEQIVQEEEIELSSIPLHALYLLMPNDYKEGFIARIKRLFNEFNSAEPMLDEDEISCIFAIVDDFFQQVENEKQEREKGAGLALTKQIGESRG